ncbi:MAG: hypothetical protein AB1649_15195 [Chloroflexota bacterium]
MLQILTGLSIWLHALGTVILIVYFLLLYLVYLPVLATKMVRPHPVRRYGAASALSLGFCIWFL